MRKSLFKILLFPFKTIPNMLITIFFLLILYKVVRHYGWGVLNPKFSLGAWGAMVSGCGGGLLSWISIIPRSRIIEIGTRETAVLFTAKNTTGTSISSAAFTLILMVLTGTGVIMGVFSLISSVQEITVFDIIVNLFGIMFMILSLAIVGSFVTSSLPSFIEKLFFNAKDSPANFRKSVIRIGFQLLLAGSALQVIDGTTLPKCDNFIRCSGVTQSPQVPR